jgi:CheY-like chemotaxis protein
MSSSAHLGVQQLHDPYTLHGSSATGKAVEGMSKILVAEDNPADVYLIRAALQEHGIDLPLQVAADGREVLQIICQLESMADTQLNLIILDLNLPRHDGIEILQRLRESERLGRVPVVVLTSSDSPRDRILASELGAASYLRKPSSLEQFLGLGAVFKDLLERAGSQSNGA